MFTNQLFKSKNPRFVHFAHSWSANTSPSTTDFKLPTQSHPRCSHGESTIVHGSTVSGSTYQSVSTNQLSRRASVCEVNGNSLGMKWEDLKAILIFRCPKNCLWQSKMMIWWDQIDPQDKDQPLVLGHLDLLTQHAWLSVHTERA